MVLAYYPSDMVDKGKRKRMYLTSKERLGLIALAFLLVLIMAVSFSVSHFFPENEMNLIDKEELEAFNRFKSTLSEREKKSSGREPGRDIKKNIAYFVFDPNQISLEECLDLGLTKTTAKNIINYREAGGKFFEAQDLQKIYTLSGKEYKRLEPWIKIKLPEKDENPKEMVEGKSVEISENSDYVFKIELNSAGMEELEKLSGIGPVYANRIINYRKLLGGYYRKSQLLEVYGINQQIYEKIEKEIEIDTSHLSSISFLKADFRQLLQHPYIDKYEARGIEKIRTLDVRIECLEQIKEAGIFTEEKWEKIRPYLKLE